MKLAHVALLDDGEVIWTGTLTQFLRDNDLGAAAAKRFANQLRPHDGRLEPAIAGGGAHGDFLLSLIDAA